MGELFASTCISLTFFILFLSRRFVWIFCLELVHNYHTMKTKFIFCLLLLSIFSTYTYSQDDYASESEDYSDATIKKPRFWIGPKFGTDFVGVPTNMDVVKGELKEQWQAGVLMQFGRTLYLQPEAYYCLDNIVLPSEGVEASSNAKIKVPVMLGLRFLNLGLVSLHIMGGPQWTMPMKDSDGNSTGSTTREWLVGAGVDILGFITTDVRYVYNPNVALNDQITSFDYKTAGLNVTVGFKFR
jgi:hypothetical protein